MSKIVELTQEQKEKLLNRIKIETEDIPTTVDPIEQFKATLHSYNENMSEQIERINTSLPLHYQILDEVMGQQNGLASRAEYQCKYKTSDEALQTEFNTRKEITKKMVQSRILMEQRLNLAEEVEKFCVEHFEDIIKLDLYFGCALNLQETRERVEELLQDVEE